MIHRDPEPNPRWWYTPLVGILAIAAIGFAMTKDYEDAEREYAHYCSMVEQGAWPNYKEIDCND